MATAYKSGKTAAMPAVVLALGAGFVAFVALTVFALLYRSMTSGRGRSAEFWHGLFQGIDF